MFKIGVGIISGGVCGYIGDRWYNLNKKTHRILQSLDELESVPARFSVGSRSVDLSKILTRVSNVRNELERSYWWGAKKQCAQLVRRQHALEYRWESVNGGKDPLNSSEQSLVSELSALIHEQGLVNPQTHPRLLKRLESQLKELCRYESIALNLRDNQELRAEFFSWAVIEGNSVSIYTEFPHLQQKLKECYLSQRIGAFGGIEGDYPLKIRKLSTPQGMIEKVVTLPINFREVSILDENTTISLENGYQLRLSEVFEIFSRKITVSGNLEFFQNGGIRNWNTHHRARWNPETGRHDKTKTLPEKPFKGYPKVRTVSVETLTEEYRISTPRPGDWVLGVRSSKLSEGADLIVNHACLEVMIPRKSNPNLYHIFNLGLYMADFPETAWGFLKTVGNTVPAAMVYPDETVYQPERQHVSYARPLTDEEKKRLQEVIIEDFNAADTSNLSFQLETENCAKKVQQITKRVWGEESPNFFRVNLFEVKAPGFSGVLVKGASMLPKALQMQFLHAYNYPFLPHRGLWIEENGERVWKSVTTSEFWNTGDLYLPSIMHERVDANEI